MEIYEAIFEAELDLLGIANSGHPGRGAHLFGVCKCEVALLTRLMPGPGGEEITALSSDEAFMARSANGSGGPGESLLAIAF